ncbi:MAG: DUF1189 domain-containing protein [Candidatus Omnitrophica bacterium]|nr:DUF1189 domain-containing protein [Candidatus Omnitrophota bacterium]
MFSVFKAFNPKFYPEIAKQSTGRSIGFLLIFVLIISSLVSAKYTVVTFSGFSAARKWVKDNLSGIASQYPSIAVDKGNVLEPKDAFVKEYDKNFAVVIEPDPANAKSAQDKYTNMILLTKNMIVTKQTDRGGTAEVKTYNLENKSFTVTPFNSGFKIGFENKVFELTAKVIDTWFGIISWFVFPALLILWFVIWCIVKPLHIFIFSLISLIIGAVSKARLAYKELWNIGAYAIVPGTSLAVLMDILGLKIPLAGLIYWIIYIVYLYLGIKEAAAEVSA